MGSGTISVSLTDRQAVIRLGRRFDFAMRRDFRRACERELPAESIDSYLFDLRETRDLDSAALGMLLLFRERVGSTVPVDIVNCRPRVRELLDIARFDRYFSVR